MTSDTQAYRNAISDSRTQLARLLTQLSAGNAQAGYQRALDDIARDAGLKRSVVYTDK